MFARAPRAPAVAGAFVAVLAAWLLAGPVVAAAADRDWNRTDDPLYESLGLHAGKIGGTGLAFKFPVRWWLYGQVAGGIWHTGDNKRHNAGLMFQYLLRQDRRVRFFVAAGLGYYYHSQRVEVVGGPDRWQRDDSWNTGFGVGGELLQGERWSIQLEADFTHQGDDGSIIVFPQAGVYYYF